MLLLLSEHTVMIHEVPMHQIMMIVFVNGLLYVQPVVLFAAKLPRAAKWVGAITLALTLYAIYPAVLSAFGLTPPMSGPEAKGNWFFYWIFCMVCGLVNAVFLGTSLLGRLLAQRNH
jgi:hypothetical protein